MRYKPNMKNSDMPCKNMEIINREGINIICKLTNLKCVSAYDTNSLGMHSFLEDLKRCPSFKPKNLTEFQQEPISKKKNKFKRIKR